MSGRIAHLSLAALRMAASMPCHDTSVVARWLYHFGAVPRTPGIEQDFGPEDDPLAVLSLTVGGIARRQLEVEYEATSVSGWCSFARTPAAPMLAAACKLYVSPRPEALGAAFPRIVRVLAHAEVRSFKVGRGIEGLLRPDKIVAYFDTPEHMHDVTHALAAALPDCPAQGVPFTTDLAGDGLLSAGVDPPIGSGGASSWRAWVSNRLALGLSAHAALPRADAVAATLADVRAQGVDPDRWRVDARAFIPEALQ